MKRETYADAGRIGFVRESLRFKNGFPNYIDGTNAKYDREPRCRYSSVKKCFDLTTVKDVLVTERVLFVDWYAGLLKFLSEVRGKLALHYILFMACYCFVFLCIHCRWQQKTLHFRID